MSRTQPTSVAVKILSPPSGLTLPPSERSAHELPARSRLYGLAPCEVGSVWVESLTSYLHRLAARYGVAPRVFVTQAVFSHLASWYETRPSFATHLGSFYRREALAMNGTGKLAQRLAQLLCQLTSRADLQDTTLALWADYLPVRSLLRWSPAWCPSCYTTWRESEQAIYQPLV